MGSPAAAITTRADVEDIDPWGEDDDTEHTPRAQTMDLEREWEARRSQFHNLGYRDGISAGTNSSAQEGFNAGFKEAVAQGFSWGVARGASSSYALLSSSLKELLLKDPEASKRLEALHSSISNISSATAMGMYYEDSVLRDEVQPRESLHGQSSDDSATRTSALLPVEEKANTEGNRPAGAFGSSGACDSHNLNDVSRIAEEKCTLDDSNHPSSSQSRDLAQTSGDERVSNEAHKLVLNVSTNSAYAKQLEDSSTSLLGSLTLGEPIWNALNCRDSDSLSRLEQYQKKVKAEIECSVRLTSFPKLQ